jgi:hypothetical protein
VESIKSENSLWMLHCKNQKCRALFDYFGPLRRTSVSCTNCGKRFQYAIAAFQRHSEEA